MNFRCLIDSILNFFINLKQNFALKGNVLVFIIEFCTFKIESFDGSKIILIELRIKLNKIRDIILITSLNNLHFKIKFTYSRSLDSLTL